MKSINLLIQLIGISFISSACSCAGYETDFFKNLSYNQHYCVAVFKSMTVESRPNGTIPQTSHFKFLSPIKWEEGADNFVVIGQDGLNCGDAMFGFQEGDTMVLALNDGFFGTYGKDTLYLHGCGRHYLTIKNGQSGGMTVPQIIQKLKLVTGLPHVPSPLDLLHVFPNPATGKVTVHCEEPIRSVLVLNAEGQEVLFLKARDKQFSFDISQLLKGLYYVHVKTGMGEVTRRIVKQ